MYNACFYAFFFVCSLIVFNHPNSPGSMKLAFYLLGNIIVYTLKVIRIYLRDFCLDQRALIKYHGITRDNKPNIRIVMTYCLHLWSQ